ncbi:hypothetical protein GP486_004578 [Trichoglossum hirsutum]|uniref:Acetoacetyl-CoA synthase n=1 Tax=Trichoglossum hirsutum TaxID=265104 RepID=A0A9P8LAM3_9PEZI|nr:hypothetical protein GP486_004578 [Trichoglossum hirsutum]
MSDSDLQQKALSVADHLPLWEHPAPESTRIHLFKESINRKFDVKLNDYKDLYRWSVGNPARFWEEVWIFTGIRASIPFQETSIPRAFDERAPMFPRPAFFQGARLNFAENLLFPTCAVDEDSPAVISATEVSREYVSWKELRERVRQCAASMRAIGISKGDRVAGFLANHTNTLTAMLSATSLGALWTGVSPDTGVHAVLERLVQIEPKLLFADNAVVYNSKIHDTNEKVCQIVRKLPGLEGVVIFDTVSHHRVNLSDLDIPDGRRAWTYSDFVGLGDTKRKLEFAQLEPDHPVYILYSSGTTGKPKCIVHGAIGTLIQHKKEHDIHCDIRPGDRLFYFTTCTWMMWHWLVSGLAVGATIILYDGSPFKPLDEEGKGELAMPRLIDALGITHFGTSAKYLSILEQKEIMPRLKLPMSKLRAIYSTGSVLAPSTFQYVYRAFGPNINLGSITGGTDIISLFGAPSQLSPVYAGEIQVRGLGMAVKVWDYEGKDVTDTGEPGDLVCVKPFPCQPVGFWGADGEATYKKSYFERFPGVWHHGDFVKVNPKTEGLVMLGRSDGILKPAGVRFGSAEIYNVLLQHFPEEVADALCIGRRRQTDSDETVILFVKMADGCQFSHELAKNIQAKIRTELSARHVPSVVDECHEIPVTTNGKKVEVAVKQILCGMNVKTSASVANSECLDFYREWAESH